MGQFCNLLFPAPCVLTAILWSLAPAVVRGHGDVHESIVMISQEIEAKPGDATLRFERASLYAQHEEFAKALEDLAQVNMIEPANDLPLALRGSILRRMGKQSEARSQQEAFLKKHPEHAQVRFDYCRTLAELGETGTAMRELDRLIAAAEHPSPDAVAMRLSLTESRGDAGPAAALEFLDSFLTKHPLPVFQEEALRLEIKLGRTGDAVKRMDAMIAKAPRPEFLCLRKAELLESTGDKTGALAAARAAAEAIGRLPLHVRATRAAASLEARAAHFLPPSSP